MVKPKCCASDSEVAVLFYQTLIRSPFLGNFIDLDLLLCKEFDSKHADSDLFLCLFHSEIKELGFVIQGLISCPEHLLEW